MFQICQKESCGFFVIIFKCRLRISLKIRNWLIKILTQITNTSATNHLRSKIQTITVLKFMDQGKVVYLLQDTIRFGEGQLIFRGKYKSEKVKKQQITAFKSK
jgi:hypothetical protein